MTVCTYFDRGGPSEWLCRLMAIGWLEKGREYNKGGVGAEIVEKLKSLSQAFVGTFPSVIYRGLHTCTLCPIPTVGYDSLPGSDINLFIPTRGFVYVAPGRIDHYIEVHGYSPPEGFAEAVLTCPNPRSSEYRKRMAESNRGYDAPIFFE
jgi:hypothetical protein